MRVSPLGATLVASLVSLLSLAPSAVAQNGAAPGAARPAAAAAPPAAPTGTNVAVIDVAQIFKSHVRFNDQMAQIKKDIEAFEGYVRGKQQEFNTKREALAQFQAGSKDYKDREEELAKMQSDLQVDVGLKRKAFLEQEARVYYHIYKEIEQSVAIFAQRYRIGLVLRYTKDDMKPEDRNSVLQGVNRAVVYHGGLDITDQILRELNAGATPTTQPGAQGVPQTSQRPTSPIIPGRGAKPY